MGAQVSRRYKYGIRPKKYFKTKIMPEMKETFGILDFTYQNAYQLFKAFIEIDFDNSGEVTVQEFHQFLGLKPSRFSERIFGILDLDESGALEFNEFVIGIWNFCTYDALLITKFAFDIFDIDDIGKLQLAECEALIRMVYDEADADPDLMKKIDADQDGEITIDEFAALITRQPQILQPAFDMQRALRNKCFGIKFWELATEKRKDYFASYDSLANSSWEKIQKILLIRQKEREEEAKREQEAFVAEAHERMTEHKDKKTEQFNEQQERRKKTMERIRAKELPEEADEREHWAMFAECKSNMDAECTFARLSWKIDERAAMWDLMDKLKSMHDVTMEAQEARDIALADGPDGDAKADAYLRTKAGKKKILFDTTVCYGNMLHKNWVKGNALQRVLAPMFKPEGQGQVTVMARVAKKMICGNKGDLDAAHTEALGSTTER
jgi:Ca2+-binding EF-hand superfamily protein